MSRFFFLVIQDFLINRVFKWNINAFYIYLIESDSMELQVRYESVFQDELTGSVPKIQYPSVVEI